MAVYVHKVFNRTAGVVPEGVAIAFSSTGSYLYVLNAEGERIAFFRTQDVKKYWIESSPVSSFVELKGM